MAVERGSKRGQGEGSYTKLPDGRVRWRTTVTTPAGERIAASGTASNMTEARKAVRETRQAGENQTLTRKKDLITVRQLVEDYIDARVRGDKIKARTVDDYRYTLGKYIQPHIGELKAQKVSGDDLKRFFDALELERVDAGKVKGTGDRTRAKIHLLLQASFRWGVQQGICPRDPTVLGRPKPVRKGEPEGKINKLTPEQVGPFYEYARSHQDYWIFAVMLASGLRPGEALGLRQQDLLWKGDDKVRITVRRTRSLSQGKVYEDTPKTERSQRTITLRGDPALLIGECVQRIKEDAEHPTTYKGRPYEVNDYLFVSRAGTPLRLDNLTTRLRKACEAAGVPVITPHMLRRTYTSVMGASGTDVEVLARQLGHTNSDLTRERYRDVYDTELEDLTLDPTQRKK
ncbi:tyrosine recombinase XerC [Deinococcus xinjiangensis]|uniref:Tyrosine recombinase XerC n=1 Tax=Deinococcus xinjiangensis TaxID=457454 RepID=A0ABP9VES7_9DEIO